MGETLFFNDCRKFEPPVVERNQFSFQVVNVVGNEVIGGMQVLCGIVFYFQIQQNFFSLKGGNGFDGTG
jgi:hypothetical protein